MRALLIYPVFPPTFWSYNKILELVDRKVLLPPLGMVTVAAILPQEWEFKLVDRNIRAVTEAEWEWAEIVILSGMIVQRQDLIEQIHEAKQRGKLLALPMWILFEAGVVASRLLIERPPPTIGAE